MELFAFAAAVVIADPEAATVINGMFVTTYEFAGTTQYGVTFDPEGTDLISALNLAADYLKGGTAAHTHTYVCGIDNHGARIPAADAIAHNRRVRAEIRRSQANHPAWSGLSAD